MILIIWTVWDKHNHFQDGDIEVHCDCSGVVRSGPRTTVRDSHGPGDFLADSAPSSPESQLSMATSALPGCKIYLAFSQRRPAFTGSYGLSFTISSVDWTPTVVNTDWNLKWGRYDQDSQVGFGKTIQFSLLHNYQPPAAPARGLLGGVSETWLPCKALRVWLGTWGT